MGHHPSDADGDSTDAILDLIADVHGDAAPEQQVLDRAVKTLEEAHRLSARAMQRFERTGRTAERRPSTEPEHTGAPGRAARNPTALEAIAPGDPVAEERSDRRGWGHRPAAAAASILDLDQATALAKPTTQATTALAPKTNTVSSGDVTAETTATYVAVPGSPVEPPPITYRAPPPVPQILSGRGAEFIDKGRTRTHIVWPPARPPRGAK